MSFGIGQLKYEIDKITRLTSSTKRLPLFAYLFQAIVNEALDLTGEDTRAGRTKDLTKLKVFCEQEAVQTMFIILYPLYKNLCMLTGRNPKDIAILLALAIIHTGDGDLSKLKSYTGLNLEAIGGESELSRKAMSYILQGRTTTARREKILPESKEFLEKLTKFSGDIRKAQDEADTPKTIDAAIAFAALSVMFLAIFMNMVALDKFQSSDDESRAASLVLQTAVEAFGNNGIYDLDEFIEIRTKVMKPRERRV